MARLLPAVALLAGAAACVRAGPCPMPLDVCEGTCVDLRSDPRHCGACGRACGAGRSCSDGACGEDAAAACASRSGGAFVTLEACGETAKLWITNEKFVADAEALLAGATLQGYAVLELLAGTDCDAQWTWHANGATATFASAPAVGTCDVCPGELEVALSYYVNDVGTWCPSSPRVLSVDRR